MTHADQSSVRQGGAIVVAALFVLIGTAADTPRAIDDRLYIITQVVNERPAFIRVHRLFERGTARALIDERQFFVSHTYNSLQTITALLPIDEGTLLLYAIRTSTDSVDGLTTSIAHRIGRGRLREAVVEHLETLRR